MKYILSLSGGFHNSDEIRVRVSEDKVLDYLAGNISLGDVFSDYQRKRLERHFCGIKECTCGSFNRADVEVH